MLSKFKILAAPVLLLVVGVLLISGCETVKGMGTDISNGTKNTCNFLTKADKWMRDHMW